MTTPPRASAQGMFRLAGRNDLGLRIRPILRRVLRKLEDQEAKEAESETSETPETPEAPETETPATEAETTEVAASDESAG